MSGSQVPRPQFVTGAAVKGSRIKDGDGATSGCILGQKHHDDKWMIKDI